MVMKKLINKRYSVVFVNSIGMLGGGILAFLTSLWVEGYPMIRDTEVTMQWVANYYGIFTEKIVMLGIYSGLLIIIANIICYNLYGYLLSRYSATFLSFVGFMTPLFAALLGWIYLGEPVTWHFFATLLIVLCGLSLFHTKQVIEFEERGL
jgi:drug/metabolite transporter (DMT)-like permease